MHYEGLMLIVIGVLILLGIIESWTGKSVIFR
jgi:hypothetical protein